MNKSMLVVLVPSLLVALGYVLVLRHMGYAPGYPRLLIAMFVFFGAVYWLSRRASRKARSSQS
jgi:ABC-type spermidine/putrescine transport system permease subunit II